MGIIDKVLSFKIGADSSKYERAIKRSKSKTTSFADDAVKSFKRVSVAATAVAASVGVAVKKSVQSYEEFEVALNRLGNVSDDSLGTMRARILDVDAALGSTAELTKGYYQVMSAGVTDASKAMDLLTVSAGVSKEATIEQADAVKGLASVMSTYSKEVETAKDAADLLYSIERYGITSVGELTPLIGNLANMSKAAGLSANEMAAAMAQISTTGAGTAMSVTQLQSILTALSKKFDTLPESIKKYGSSLDAVKALGFQGVMKEIWNATDGNSSALINMLGRQEAYLGLLQLSKDEFKGYEDRLEGVADKVGAFEDAWSRYGDTFRSVKEEFINTIGRESVLLGEKLAPKLKEVTTDTSAWVSANSDFIGLKVNDSIYATTEALKSIVEIYESMPAGAIGYGIVGSIIAGNLGPAKLAAAITLISTGLDSVGMGWEGYIENNKRAADTLQNFIDVLTGEKHWNTGATLGRVTEEFDKMHESFVNSISDSDQLGTKGQLTNGGNAGLDTTNKITDEEKEKALQEAIKQGEAMKDIWLSQAEDKYEILSNQYQAEIDLEAANLEAAQSMRQDFWQAQIEGRKQMLDRSIKAEVKAEKDILKLKEQSGKSKYNMAVSLGTAMLSLAGADSKAIFAVTQGLEVGIAIMAAFAASNLALANPPGPPATAPLAAATLNAGLMNAAAIAAVGFGQIVASSVGGSSGGGTYTSPTITESSDYDVAPTVDETEQKGNLTINIEGDVLADDYYIERLAEKISDAVESYDVRLVATSSKTADALA